MKVAHSGYRLLNRDVGILEAVYDGAAMSLDCVVCCLKPFIGRALYILARGHHAGRAYSVLRTALLRASTSIVAAAVAHTPSGVLDRWSDSLELAPRRTQRSSVWF